MSTESAALFFSQWESDSITNWKSFNQITGELTERYQNHRLVWRGARDANWGVQSSLYRALTRVLGHTPSENEMVAAEVETLERARMDWRFDGRPALELLAELQHLGAPTRLLDVTENPLVALWFATEAPVLYSSLDEPESEQDGRIFAFVAPREKDVRFNDDWKSRNPRWHSLTSDVRRAEAKWGTGDGRRFWRPPVVHSRIAAQSAGFLIDGVPMESAGNNFGTQGPASRERWGVDAMREFSSIPLKLTVPREGELPMSSSPVFTFRVERGAKAEIRALLENRYAIRASSIYSDMPGLAHFLAQRPEQFVGQRRH